MTASKQADPVYPVPKRLLEAGVPKPHVSSFNDYKKLWEESVNEPDKFFGKVRKSLYCCLTKMAHSQLRYDRWRPICLAGLSPSLKSEVEVSRKATWLGSWMANSTHATTALTDMH